MGGGRLIVVRTVNAALLIVLTLVVGAPVALAADAPASSAPDLSAPAPSAQALSAQAGNVSLSVHAGLDGYVDPSAAFPVDVELGADSLFVGRLEMSTRTGTSGVAVEVPAGGVKRYQLVAPAAADRRRITVRLVDGDGEEVASETVTLRVPAGELLVGTLGVDGVTGLDTDLRSATTTPLGRDVVTVPLTTADLGPALAPVQYLVAGDGTLGDLDPGEERALMRWVDQGGRLYGTTEALSPVADVAGGTTVPGTGLVVARHGGGEIGILADLGGGPEMWGAILRDRPGSIAVVDQSSVQPGASLVAAASSGQQAAVPALPWLLAGIVVFVLLVGPVNFLVLRSIGRPEWAWATVPALSLLFLAGFWTIGRSQLADFSASHATVVIDDGGGAVAQAGFLIQVDAAGEHRIAIPEGWEAVTSPAPAGLRSGTSTDDAVVFDLDDLGLGGTEMRWAETQPALDGEIGPRTEGGMTVTVENTSPWTMWAWGVVVNGSGFNGTGELAPGAKGTVDVPSGIGRSAFEAVIAETVGRRPYTADRSVDVYSLVQPMAAQVEASFPQIRRRGVHVFGITDGRTLAVDIDGRTAESEGHTLYVSALDVDPSALVSLGGIRPSLLDVKGASSIERYGDEIYAYGAESVTLLYELPEGAPNEGTLRNQFTGFDRLERWDWEGEQFVPVATGGPIDLESLASTGGELVIRATVGDDRAFFDQAISLQRYAITWEAE